MIFSEDIVDRLAPGRLGNQDLQEGVPEGSLPE
jgi:hypothetical protein